MNTKIKLTVGSMANQCQCGLRFKSVGGHERHRIGRFGIDRRCMTVSELVEAGFTQNVHDQWVPIHDEEAAARLAKLIGD